MSAVHLCHQCDNVFVCVRSVVLTIVMQTLCISVGRAGFIQICYEFKNIWKRVISTSKGCRCVLSWASRSVKASKKQPRTLLMDPFWTIFTFFRRKSWGLFRTAGLWNTCLQKSAMKLLSCQFEKLRQARLDEQHKKPTVFNVGLCLRCPPTFLNGCKISKTTNMNLWRAQVNHMTRYTSRLLIICWTVRLFWHQNYTTYTFQLGV